MGDRGSLEKSAHFLATKENVKLEKLEKMYMEDIVTRHGAPLSIISDRDSCFSSRFGQKGSEELGTTVHSSTTYHLETCR